MTEIIEIGQPPIEVHLRRSTRARRYSLRISNSSGVVSLTLPKRASARAAIGFAREQEEWLRRNLAKRPLPLGLFYGGTLLLDGHSVELQQGTNRVPLLQNGILTVKGPEEQLGARLRGYLKTRAAARLVGASERYASALGQKINKVTLRDTRSRWGSCSSQGNLMYSWRLAMAPPIVQDYVAAHEVCHLIEMNHSPAYWQLVDSIFPDYPAQRKWLRDHGASLHRYQF